MEPEFFGYCRKESAFFFFGQIPELDKRSLEITLTESEVVMLIKFF